MLTPTMPLVMRFVLTAAVMLPAAACTSLARTHREALADILPAL